MFGAFKLDFYVIPYRGEARPSLWKASSGRYNSIIDDSGRCIHA